LIVLLMIAAAGAGAPGGELAAHLERYPVAEAVDVYKFLHQRVFGPGHMIPDRAAAERFLVREIESLEAPLPGEPVCERLGGDPPMLRVHLRPFLAASFDEAALLDAFVRSANRIEGDRKTMDRALGDAARWLRSTGKAALADDLDRLRAEQRPQGFPALHHSERFRAGYKPAYRVILAGYAIEHGWCQ